MTAAQLTYTSELIEDYFPFVPADATGNLIVAVASDQAAIPTPSVVVANGSGVVWYRPDPESASGWTADASPAFAGTVIGLSAFELNGVLVAVVTIQQQNTTVVQVWYRMPDGMPQPVGPGWVQAPYPNNATSLAAGNVDYVTAAGGFGHGYIVLHTSKGSAFFYLPSVLIAPTIFVLREWTAVSTAPLTLKPGSDAKGNQSFGGRGSKGFDAVHLVPTYAAGKPTLWLGMSGPQKFGLCELPADLSQFPQGFWNNYPQVSAASRSVPVTNPAQLPTAGRSTLVPLLSPQGGITWVIAQPGTEYDLSTDTNAPAGVTSLAGCFVSDGASGGQATYVVIGGSPAAVWMTDQPGGS